MKSLINSEHISNTICKEWSEYAFTDEDNIDISYTFIPDYNFTKTQILDTDEFILSSKSKEGNHIIDWMTNRGCKTLSIRSPYNTGKFTVIKQMLLCAVHIFQRVLYVTCKRSFDNDVYRTLKLLKYSICLDDKYYNYFDDKIVCHVDNICNLCCFISHDRTDDDLFDLVILDETCSILNHFESYNTRQKNNYFSYLYSVCVKSYKVMMLDDDFGDREYYFANMINKSIPGLTMVNNIIKKRFDVHFINNFDRFNVNIFSDLKDGFSIMMVTLSTEFGDLIFDKYKNEYNCVIHNLTTGEKIIHNNNFGSKHRLLIYILTSEISFYFNLETQHFDKIYGIMTCDSASPNSFCKILAKCHGIKEKKILIYTNGLKYNDHLIPYTLDEVKDYINEWGNDDYTIITVDKKDNIKRTKTLYYNIDIHNILKNHSKKSEYFLFDLVRLLKSNGHYVDV